MTPLSFYLKGLHQVSQNVFFVLNPNRKPEQLVGNALSFSFPGRHQRMRGQTGLDHGSLNASQAHGRFDEFQVLLKGFDVNGGLQLERQHAAKSMHLPLGKAMTGMIF